MAQKTDSLLFQSESHTSNIQVRDVAGPEADLSLTTETLTSLNTSPSSTQTTGMTTSPVSRITEMTSNMTTLEPPHSGITGSTAITIIIVLVLVSAFLVLIYFCLKKKGKLSKLVCYLPVTRTRRSSTSSSRRALEEHEVMEDNFRQKPEGQADDMFTIDEFDNNADPQGGREEYYYDEVFGQSQFEDEATNNAMRQLYSDSDPQPEEEMLDLDFETLGIKIQDYSPDPGRKNTI